MKYLSLVVAFIVCTNVYAGNSASQPQSDLVVDIVELDFDEDGLMDTAYLAKSPDMGSDDLDLWIKLFSDQEFFRVEGLTANMTAGSAGMSNKLQVNPQGSIQVYSYNDAIGRSRWAETITFAYRNKTIVLAGYTYFERDTLDLSYSTCDLNLLALKGTLKSSDGDATFDIAKKDRLKLYQVNFDALSSLYLMNYCSSFDFNESDF